MQFIIVAGFLGSGKTSILRNILSLMTEEQKKDTVLIVNDFGQVGIDRELLSKQGLDPIELVSGCVCCQLGVDMIKTIEEIHQRYSPRMVFIEPSGVANPGSIKQIIKESKTLPIERVLNIVLVDPVRWHAISDIPVIEEGLRNADLLVITKRDLCQTLAIDKLREELHGINSSAGILETNSFEIETFHPLLDEIFHDEAHSEFSCVSRTLKARLLPDYRKQVFGVLQDMVKNIETSGVSFVGHIKTLINDEAGCCFYASITDPSTGPGSHGHLQELGAEVSMKIQAVVFRLNSESLQTIVDECLRGLDGLRSI